MPGARITTAQRRRFYNLHLDADGPHLPAAVAARKCGFSYATAGRILAGVKENDRADDRRAQRDLPNPIPWEELSPDAASALADFNVFRELFFARRAQVWARDASLRILEALSDTSQRTFLDLNVFPGSGKSTVGIDLGCWLIAGGGFCKPQRGRAIRLMYGSETMDVAVHMVKAIRNFLSLRRPFYDIEQDRHAQAVLGEEYGRFKPVRGYDPDVQWTEAQFVVAQMTEVELYQKEPTVQAASYKKGFLGERANLAWWDDLTTTKNSSTAASASAVATFFTNEAERRIERGGVCALVGQRLSPLDLHKKRLDARRRDGAKLYQHIVYPAHHDGLCDGSHRQWDGTYDPGAGCLTDEVMLPERDWEAVAGDLNYRTVYQQEDADPSKVLVQKAWIEGGIDSDGFDAPGCLNRDRSFGAHPPKEVGRLINYVAVDPSVSNFWALEWWAYQPESRFNYLIWGERRKMQAFQLLGWDNAAQSFTGLMEDFQRASVAAAQPIRVWVIESNAAHKYLVQTSTYRDWRKAWPDVSVIAHETLRNKLDPELGVSGLLPQRYRTGHKDIPYKPGAGVGGRTFLSKFIEELTTYPYCETDDSVLADWMGEMNLPRIVQAAKRQVNQMMLVDAHLPGYLRARQHEVAVASAAS